MRELSIVLCGRNDDHGGGFVDRLTAAAEHNLALLADAGVEAEIVWVEWNPPVDRPLLAHSLAQRFDQLRAWAAGPEIHALCCDNPNMTIMEFFAKNAGIRRSRYEWVLTTNADILLDRPTVDRLIALEKPLESRVYRAIRHDLKDCVPPADATSPANWQFSHATTPPYHAEGAGDFILASKQVFESLRGFNETIRFAKLHKDTQFCIHASKLGFVPTVVGDVYHIHHPNSWIHLPMSERTAENAPWGPPYNYRANLPYLNPPNWGLVDYGEELAGYHVHRLLPPLSKRVEERRVTEGVLSEAAAAYQVARSNDESEFRSEYVAGIARLLRSREDPAAPAIAILRRYVCTLWANLIADETVRRLGVALYGAGRHTEWLLRLVKDMPGPRVECILDDHVATDQTLEGVAIRRPTELALDSVGAIVVSSDSHEAKIVDRCHALFPPRIRIVRIYNGLPTGLFTQDENS